MSFLLLPPEILREIFKRVCPVDLVNLILTTRHFNNFIRHHEQFLCKYILADGYAASRQCFQRPKEMSPLQTLQLQWYRQEAVKSLVLNINSLDTRIPQGLHFIWSYHDALQADLHTASAENHRAFIRSSTAEDLETMMTSVAICSQLLLDCSGQSVLASTNGEEGVISWKKRAYIEAVLLKGVAFIKKVVIEKDLDAMDSLGHQEEQTGTRITERFYEELRLKQKLRSLTGRAGPSS